MLLIDIGTFYDHYGKIYISKCFDTRSYLRNKSWKPECVGSFNMDWRILVFYPEPVLSEG